MKWWFCYNGADSEGFKELAQTIEARKLKEAEALRESLILLRQMRPEDYPHEKGEDQLTAYQADVALHETYYKRYVEKGYLEDLRG